MSSTPNSSAGDAGAIRERMERIRRGMEVIDASGKAIGKVAYVWIGALDRSEFKEQESGGLACGKSDVAAGLVGRLLQGGYIKIDEARQSQWVHHYYATEEEIVSVEEDKVLLSKDADELMKSLD